MEPDQDRGRTLLETINRTLRESQELLTGLRASNDQGRAFIENARANLREMQRHLQDARTGR